MVGDSRGESQGEPRGEIHRETQQEIHGVRLRCRDPTGRDPWRDLHGEIHEETAKAPLPPHGPQFPTP